MGNKWKELNKPTMSHTFAINIYDPCPKCESPLNPYHEKNGCSIEIKKAKKVKPVLKIVETLNPTCEKCDSIVPDKYLSGTRPDELWVECSCGAHNGWYCENHSPGNDCYDDEECDCCNPIITESPNETWGEKQVVGMGYMSFYSEEDMLNQIVYCKNGCWKLKGDKTARDLDGDLCITDDDDEDEEEAELEALEEWRGVDGCYCQTCWEFCKMGSVEEYKKFMEVFKANIIKKYEAQTK